MFFVFLKMSKIYLGYFCFSDTQLAYDISQIVREYQLKISENTYIHMYIPKSRKRHVVKIVKKSLSAHREPAPTHRPPPSP